jgi:phage terminase large subunit GpA-like protein
MQCDFSFITPDIREMMLKYLLRKARGLPSEVTDIGVPEYAEQKRILPAGTPFPGPWSNRKTPYLVEIMNNMSVNSPVSEQYILKGAQLGFTAAAENVVVYWMDAVPAPILFISATEDGVKRWAEMRLEPAIDSCGAREKIFAQSKSSSSRRAGDKTLSKEFAGGSLNMVSAQSANSLRSQSIRILIGDEVDGAPQMLRTGEGSWDKVAFARTFAWGEKAKVMFFSTPTTISDSLISKLHENGDQRLFMVPCPFCGGCQHLEWGSTSGSFGMRGETTAGVLTDVYYMCSHCREPIRDHNKQYLLDNGYWEPTARGSGPNIRSYHLPSLYSPVGMLSWRAMWQKYTEAVRDNELRAFTNLYLGLPYREAGEKPKLENVIELRDSGYRKGQIPHNDILFLTAAVDVQRGSEKGDGNPARLEMEICGHGENFRTWSINYLKFEGSVSDPWDGAWAAMDKWVRSGGFNNFVRPDGKRVMVEMVFIDSGDGTLTDVVYAFCGKWTRTFPCKGTQTLKKTRESAGDAIDGMNVRRYKTSTIPGGQRLVVISTNYYKHHIYNNLNNTYRYLDEKEGRPGICYFPFDYEDSYFAMLTA